MRDGIDLDLITTFGRLLEAGATLQRDLGRELERECGIPHTWLEVMLRISRSPDGQVPMSTLAGQLTLTSGGVTRLLDRMGTAGYVARVPCPTDRRVTYAVLTPTGQERLREASTLHTQQLREVFDGFSPADLRSLDTLLDRLRPGYPSSPPRSAK
ncbi:MarR family winged helix-turn-helix transcriptional regulator [Ornithinimicrobium sediminis]|uniref:MarR family winged helix-turn-helix transcriptional regulator n=1 Tax=Ornithinimicrobium sediminis TaxID=2904603 RepID=UPI001E57E118|nr:MarR family transcriptional regulator [Ornithinimicrobium sediminis]